MTGRRSNSATELKVADALAARGAWDEGSGISQDDLWALIQPELPRGEAGREFARKKPRLADGMTEAERIAAGQRLFFDESITTLIKNGQLGVNGQRVWLGKEPLWQRNAEGAPDMYVPGVNHLRDAEAQHRIDDRKLLRRILSRKVFEVSRDSQNYQNLLWSMRHYGYRPEYPIIVDADDPTMVLVGRTRLAVAEELELEKPGITEQVRGAAVRVRGDSSEILREVFRADVFRRQLDAREWQEIRGLLDESDHQVAEIHHIESVIKGHQDKLQRRQREQQTRIDELIKEDSGRPDREIARMVGCSHHTVEARRKIIMETGQSAQFPTKTDTGASSQASSRKNGRPRRKPPPAGLRKEVRRRVRAGEPVRRDQLAVQYGVTVSAIQDIHNKERESWQNEQDRAAQEQKTPHPPHICKNCGATWDGS